MKSRCRNVNDPSFRDYGGRGIGYAASWESFDAFYRDMGDRPRGMTLDRIDVDGPYSLENCRWAPKEVQARNRRNNRIVTFQGRQMPLVELAEITGVPYQRLHERIARRGWNVEDAVSKPIRNQW